MPLHPDVALGIKIGATISRSRYTQDPGPVIDDLRTIAGDRTDILAGEVGRWIGFHEKDPHQQVLLGALRALPGLESLMEPWITLGRERANHVTVDDWSAHG